MPAPSDERLGFQARVIVVAVVVTVVLAGWAWLVWSDAAVYRWLLRLYTDRRFMHDVLQRWGILAPLAFIAIQTLQVVIAPIPGDVTGLIGGFAFGQWLGFLYSTIGLTIGSLLAFWLGRSLGAPFIRRVTGPEVWQHLDFVVEAEGAIVCFVIFLVPGLPKDTLCYLFGVSPIPFWLFAVISTLGRMPGTWVLSAGGAKAAAAQYVQLLLLIAVVAATTLPLYYYRSRIVMWLQHQRPRGH